VGAAAARRALKRALICLDLSEFLVILSNPGPALKKNMRNKLFILLLLSYALTAHAAENDTAALARNTQPDPAALQLDLELGEQEENEELDVAEADELEQNEFFTDGAEVTRSANAQSL
jgi:hypothetical protein